MEVQTVFKLRVEQVTYELNISWQHKKVKAERKSAGDLRNLSCGIYTFCWEFSRGPRAEELHIYHIYAGVTYLSMKIHPKSFHIFLLKVVAALLSVSRKRTARA